jgi:proteasome lid subunit RPN8/RPN11
MPRSVCDILQETAIHQKLEELREKTKATGHEHGFNVCSDGRVTKVIEGTDSIIDKSEVNKECNYQIDISFHSHPNFYAYPSKGDYITDIYEQPRIASCVYGETDDTVTCYRTSDKLRNKYRPLIENARSKEYEAYIKMKNATNPEEEDRLYYEYTQARNNYIDVLTDVAKEVISYVYRGLNFIINPYAEVGDDYDRAIREVQRFGDYDEVALVDCGKI